MDETGEIGSDFPNCYTQLLAGGRPGHTIVICYPLSKVNIVAIFNVLMQVLMNHYCHFFCFLMIILNTEIFLDCHTK